MTYLDKILQAHRTASKDDDRRLDTLLEQAAEVGPTRGFRQSLDSAQGIAVISEIKRRSPSKGDLNVGIDPAQWAESYSRGGASCLSVLTDEEFFGGSARDLGEARAACSIPVIRKDFTVSANDVVDARIMGADAVLLIVAALDDAQLGDFYDLARELSMDVLVETHDEDEVGRALAIGADLIGVNQRDLITFEVDTARAVRLRHQIPDSTLAVAESGISGPGDIRPLVEAGYRAVLVGESLVRSGDPVAAVAALRAAAGQV